APCERLANQGRQQPGKRLEQCRVRGFGVVGCHAGEQFVQRGDLGVAGLAWLRLCQPFEFGTDETARPSVQRAKAAVTDERTQLVSQAAPGLDQLDVLFGTTWAALTRQHVWVELQL